MLNRNDLLLVRICQADAFAAAVEYLKYARPEDAALRDKVLRFERYFAHPNHDHPVGCYTDDGQMSVANAEVLLGGSPSPGSLALADRWVKVFKRDWRKGYARGFQAFLESVKDGQEFLDRIRPDSDKNGAAMRAAVFGVLPKIEDVLWYSTLQAKITHNTPAGILSSQVVSLMAHYALFEAGPLSKVGEWLTGHLPASQRYIMETLPKPWSGPVTRRDSTPVAITTIHAAFDLITKTNSLLDSMRQGILWGGDTDSVMAIVWGIQSCRLHDPLPEFFDRDLEPGRPYGYAFLKDLGTRLMNKYDQ